MIHTGEFIREKETQQLHEVQFEGREDICTIRVSDGAHIHLRPDQVVKVLTPSLLPGEPEITRREEKAA